MTKPNPYNSKRPQRAGLFSVGRSKRAGMTLAELLISATIIAMVAAAIAGIASTVEMASDLTYNRNLELQHGQAAVRRIENTFKDATCSESFPAARVITQTDGTYTYPDAIVIWKPKTSPSNASYPMSNELIVYAVDTTSPNELLEFRPLSTSAAPAYDSTTSWRTWLASARTNNEDKTTITKYLRTAVRSSSTTTRGCVRFELVNSPTRSEISSYRAGTTAWNDLPWPLDLYGEERATQRAWMKMEVQTQVDATDGSRGTPMFGSAAVHVEIVK